MNAFNVGQFVGGFFGFALVFLLIRWIAKRWMQGDELVVVSGVVALLVVTVARGYGAAQGGAPDFAGTFMMYVVQGVIVTGIAFFVARSRRNSDVA